MSDSKTSPLSTNGPAFAWHYPRVVAHRGGGTLAPENTLAGIRTAASFGHEMVGCVSLHVAHRALDELLVGEIRSAGLRILAYTVNDPARARELAAWGVDAICTDRIDEITDILLEME